MDTENISNDANKIPVVEATEHFGGQAKVVGEVMPVPEVTTYFVPAEALQQLNIPEYLPIPGSVPGDLVASSRIDIGPVQGQNVAYAANTEGNLKGQDVYTFKNPTQIINSEVAPELSGVSAEEFRVNQEGYQLSQTYSIEEDTEIVKVDAEGLRAYTAEQLKDLELTQEEIVYASELSENGAFLLSVASKEYFEKYKKLRLQQQEGSVQLAEQESVKLAKTGAITNALTVAGAGDITSKKKLGGFLQSLEAKANKYVTAGMAALAIGGAMVPVDRAEARNLGDALRSVVAVGVGAKAKQISEDPIRVIKAEQRYEANKDRDEERIARYREAYERDLARIDAKYERQAIEFNNAKALEFEQKIKNLSKEDRDRWNKIVDAEFIEKLVRAKEIEARERTATYNANVNAISRRENRDQGILERNINKSRQLEDAKVRESVIKEMGTQAGRVIVP